MHRARYTATGGDPVALTDTDASVSHRWPQILPGGEQVVFTATTDLAGDTSEIRALSLSTGETKLVLQGASDARYVSMGATGHLVYRRGARGDTSATLYAAPFDLERLELAEPERAVVQNVSAKVSGAANFDASRDGTLVYIPQSAPTARSYRLVWVDRDGGEEQVALDPLSLGGARLSPDGSRVALAVIGANPDIWIHELERGTTSRLTFDPWNDFEPVWTPDGEHVVFASTTRDGSANLFRKAADGTGETERLTTSPSRQTPESVSPDGRWLVFSESTGLRLLSMEEPRQVEGLIDGANLTRPAISPDGRWLAYASAETGRVEVYVRPFPDVEAGKWQISTNGGRAPQWSPNGRQLFYGLAPGRGRDGMATVEVGDGNTFEWGPPEELLFDFEYLPYSAGNAGRRFLMLKPEGEASTPSEIVIVLNWLDELERLVPVD